MSIIGRLEQRAATGPADDYWYQPGGFFYGGASGGSTKCGIAVSESSALQLAVVWCCIKILSEDSASLPLHLYRRLSGGGRERATNHPLYSLLHDSPNPEMTAFTFRETLMAHVLAWGNGYAEIVRGSGMVGSGRISALWPITPHRVTPKRNKGEVAKIPKDRIYYYVSMAGTGLPDVVLPKDNVLHVPGLSYNGLVGYSPISAAREAIGMGKALEEFGELYFSNGIHPAFVVSHPGTLKDPAAFRQATNEAYGGLGKSHRVLLLEEAMKVEKLGIPNDEAQFLETRKFQNVDIGTRIYRLPPQMYGEYDKASTYASAEQFSLDYVVKSLRPWLVRCEQSLNMALLSPAERTEYFFEHLIDGLMRGDAAARADFYAKLFNIAGISPNQICELENWNPVGPEGDKRFVPLNMVTLEDSGRQQEPKEPNNRTIYRLRLQSAYRRIFVDAVERIIRKEVKRLRWGMEKHHGSGGFQDFIKDFYRDMPGFISRQMLPAFLSLSDAVTVMEEELSGMKLNGNRSKLEQLITSKASSYGVQHVTVSIKSLNSALERGDFDGEMAAWEAERVGEIATDQATAITDSVVEYLKGETRGA